MSYVALYRKFRPDTFDDVKGQDHIVKTLKNQIKANRIGHAYLFCGTRGTGKTTVAKIFAKAVNCEHPVDGAPCNACAMCRGIKDGTSMNVIEIDAASNNGVDNIREIRESVEYRPTQGEYKVYIIDEVHMLSTGAFNALLKTLEEPPSYVIFILATTEVHKIPITILSRCQRYDFRRITIDTIASRLDELMKKEKVQVEDKAIRYIAKAADGSLRDALSLLDQCIAFYLGETLTYEHVLEVLGTVDTEVFSKLLRLILEKNVTEVIRTLEDMIISGKEMGQTVTDFIWYLRNILLVRSAPDAEEIIDISSEKRELLVEESLMIDTDTLMRFIRILSDLSNSLRYASQKRVMVEIALIKMCRPSMETNMDSILDRIRSLEEQMVEGVVLTKANARFGNASESFSANGADVENETERTHVKPIQTKAEKAAPEDLQQIKKEWRMIAGQTEGRLKVLLTTASPKYNGNTGEAKLYIEFSNNLAQCYIGDTEAGVLAKQELQNIIVSRIGKNIDIEFVLAQQGNSKVLAEIAIDDILRDKIQMEIETEE